MNEVYLGLFAALATSCLWTATSLLFTQAGKRIGPLVVNSVRICLAIVFLGLTHFTLTGTLWPEATSGQLALLALSGLIGLTLGDQALFTAFVDIGPRLAMLMMTTAPIFAAVFGFVFLGEAIKLPDVVGIAITLAGVAWVVLERPAAARPQANYARGVALGVVAAVCQAGGSLLSKQGIGHGWLEPEAHLPAQSATLVRMVFAGIGLGPLLGYYWWRGRRLRRRMPDAPAPRRLWRSGLLFALAGAVVGPFLGVWMSMEAFDRAPLGIAQTLCSLPPVLILPFSYWLLRERISGRAVVGACLAVGGTALLFVSAGV